MNEHITDEEREAWDDIAPRAQWLTADGEVIDEGLCPTNDEARAEARRWAENNSADLMGGSFRAVGLHGAPVWTYRRQPDGTVTEE